MKEVEFKKETIEYIKKYVAYDEEVFDSKEECQKYENSAKCILKHRFKQHVINDTFNEWDLLSTGDSDHLIDIVEIPDDDAIKDIVQYYSFCHSYMTEECLEKFTSKVKKAYNEEELLIFGYNYENDLYFIDSRNNIVSRLNNISRTKLFENN